VVLSTIVLGISLPTAPGFVGSYHYAAILALSLYPISAESKVVFAIIHYISGIGLEVLLGVLCIPFVKISLTDIKAILKSIFRKGHHKAL